MLLPCRRLRSRARCLRQQRQGSKHLIQPRPCWCCFAYMRAGKGNRGVDRRERVRRHSRGQLTLAYTCTLLFAASSCSFFLNCPHPLTCATCNCFECLQSNAASVAQSSRQLPLAQVWVLLRSSLSLSLLCGTAGAKHTAKQRFVTPLQQCCVTASCALVPACCVPYLCSVALAAYSQYSKPLLTFFLCFFAVLALTIRSWDPGPPLLHTSDRTNKGSITPCRSRTDLAQVFSA